MLRCQFLCHILKALFFIKIALKLSYFCKKMENFQALGAPPQIPNVASPLRISGYALKNREASSEQFLAVRPLLLQKDQ